MSLLVLGASSRMASRVAHRFAAEGHDIYLAALEEGAAEALAADLRVRYGVKAVGGSFDATDLDSHKPLLDQIEAVLGPVDVALLAFGFMGDQEASQSDATKARQVIDVNYTGAVSLSEALAERMAPRRRGSIIGISSVAGDRGRRGNYIYGSAKGAFALYLQGLRSRMHEHGVHVMTVKPGFTDTRMTWGLDTGAIPVAAPEKVAEAIYCSWQRKAEVIYVPGFWMAVMGAIKAVPERIFKRLSI